MSGSGRGVGVGRVVLFAVVVARVWCRASAMDGDGALCVSGKGMVGLRESDG